MEEEAVVAEEGMGVRVAHPQPQRVARNLPHPPPHLPFPHPPHHLLPRPPSAALHPPPPTYATSFSPPSTPGPISPSPLPPSPPCTGRLMALPGVGEGSNPAGRTLSTWCLSSHPTSPLPCPSTSPAAQWRGVGSPPLSTTSMALGVRIFLPPPPLHPPTSTSTITSSTVATSPPTQQWPRLPPTPPTPSTLQHPPPPCPPRVLSLPLLLLPALSPPPLARVSWGGEMVTMGLMTTPPMPLPSSVLQQCLQQPGQWLCKPSPTTRRLWRRRGSCLWRALKNSALPQMPPPLVSPLARPWTLQPQQPPRQ